MDMSDVDPVTPGDAAIKAFSNVYDHCGVEIDQDEAVRLGLAAAAPLLVAEAVAAERAKTANEIRAVLDAYDEYMDTDVLDSLAVAIGNLRAAAGSETTKEDGE
jgi:hypothetical protein